ncbi:alcohol dehydrogenase superfamily protein [Athelia psychrophila]|uniref:Alcohol dehydrogenase superfamily protein n=1 Tax=Athelia psychrophila TaxID=1759441 RepID=A0A166R4L5_9AGAM|nr:alcohol dehydrogenase superfamily protein [Fibularhizoctonia sp. CBS 109695]
MSIPLTTRAYYLPKRDGFESLTLTEIAIEKPKAGEVLIKVHAVSLNARDIVIVNGTANAAIPIKENLIPTSDLAGEVISIGDGVKDWKQGDRVCGHMTLSDYMYGPIVPANFLDTCLGGNIDGVLVEYRTFPARSLVGIPDHLSYEEASTLPCAALTAYNVLMGGSSLKAGETVLVLGTGGVATFALQFAAASGAHVIVTSSSDEKLELAKKLGAHDAINYVKTPDWSAEVMKITNGRGIDHIVEVGGPSTMPHSLKAVAQGGCIHIVGWIAGEKAPEPVDAVLGLLFKGARMRGVMLGSLAQFKDMNRLISANKIRPVVAKVFPFEKARDAFEALASQTHVGKIVIKVSE